MKKIQANGLRPNFWNFSGQKPHKDMALLDLYSGCGGMSTGLCLGAKLAGVNLKTVSCGLCFSCSNLLVYDFFIVFCIIELISFTYFRDGLLTSINQLVIA